MPVSPSQVQNVLKNIVLSRTVTHIATTIDRRLSDPGYIAEWVQDAKTNPTFEFAFRTTCSDEECYELRRMYMEVGWGSVIVINDVDHNKVGFCSVTIKTHPTRVSKIVICLSPNPVMLVEQPKGDYHGTH